MKSEWEKSVHAELAHKFTEVEEPALESILSRYELMMEKYDRSKLNGQLTKSFPTMNNRNCPNIECWNFRMNWKNRIGFRRMGRILRAIYE